MTLSPINTNKLKHLKRKLLVLKPKHEPGGRKTFSNTWWNKMEHFFKIFPKKDSAVCRQVLSLLRLIPARLWSCRAATVSPLKQVKLRLKTPANNNNKKRCAPFFKGIRHWNTVFWASDAPNLKDLEASSFVDDGCWRFIVTMDSSGYTDSWWKLSQNFRRKLNSTMSVVNGGTALEKCGGRELWNFSFLWTELNKLK